MDAADQNIETVDPACYNCFYVADRFDYLECNRFPPLGQRIPDIDRPHDWPLRYRTVAVRPPVDPHEYCHEWKHAGERLLAQRKWYRDIVEKVAKHCIVNLDSEDDL